MSEDRATRRQVIKLAQNRARNSVIALHHQNDPAIHEGRVRADKVWGAQQQELASSLPEGDTFRETVEFIGYLDAMVADGRLAGTIFPGRTMHDTAAGHLLVEEAGGKATDLRGNPLDYSGTCLFGHIFSVGGDMHDQLVELVRKAIERDEKEVA